MHSGCIACLSLLVVLTPACHAPIGNDSVERRFVELTLYEQEACLDASDASGGCNEPGAGEHHRVPARVAAEQDVSGRLVALHLRFSFARPNSTRAVFELQAWSDDAGAPDVLFEERGNGAVRFRAEKTAGRIEVVRDVGCPCQSGRFDLLLTGVGPDGKLGTLDDDRRRLTGRWNQDLRPFCFGLEQQLGIGDDELFVLDSPACPWSRSIPHSPAFGASNGEGSRGHSDDSSWNGGWTDDGWTDEENGWTDEDDGWTDGWTDDGWTDDGWTDDGWTDDGWTDDDDGWTDDSWTDDDDGWTDDGNDSWTDDGDDAWWDDGGDDWWEDGGDEDEWDDDDW